MNKSCCRVICGKGYDRNNNPLSILEVIYCEDLLEAELIASLILERIDNESYVYIEEIPLTTFDEYFNSQMRDSFGNHYDDKTVN